MTIAISNGLGLSNGRPWQTQYLLDADLIPEWALQSVQNEIFNGLVINYTKWSNFDPYCDTAKEDTTMIFFQTLNILGRAPISYNTYIHD
ncbi:hypothetical protein GCM10009430_32690 [Aquimarina litoralis]|uniref:Uncharacterized protein n=1 Tax=Aquimarina litoralis TaxID=584605 RepID=A0ABN1J267_9FLAO